MSPHRAPRLIAALAVVLFTLLPAATAYAACSLIISPNPGWRGADVAFTGTGFAATTGYYVNLGGEQINTGTTNQNGAFSFNYTIPGDYPTGTTNVFATDNLASCEQNPDYTVNASAPTTTTTTATTSATTTTTIPPTTTTTAAGATTTTAGSTTTAVGETTTTVADTTATTAAATDDGGGVSSVLLILLGALVGGGLVFLGVMMVRRR